MTDEMKKLANDPNFVVQFAVGDPAPALVAQPRDTGLKFSGIYYDDVKRFILKSAHMSRDDLRIFDVDTGRMVMVTHHPGKNPYDMLDPLGMTNQDKRYEVAGGEWESVCDVTARGRFHSFKIRPKWLSRHGRQYVKVNDDIKLNVGKMGFFKTMSIRGHFMIAQGDSTSAGYKCVADMMGRSIRITTARDEDEDGEDDLVAVVTKTTKALIMNAAFGSGSESTIDIAPGVDASVVLAGILAMRQVGSHFMADAFDNYVMDPAKDAVVDGVVDSAGLGGAVDAYNDVSNEAFSKTGAFVRAGRFMYENFFQ